MNIAIVGTSKIKNHSDELKIRYLCSEIIKRCGDGKATIISGGAKGVDTIAIQVAKILKNPTKVYYPKQNNWEGYKERNLQIIDNSDTVICISTPVYTKKCYHHDPPQNHEKTAGCWTLKEAEKRNKHCLFFNCDE